MRKFFIYYILLLYISVNAAEFTDENLQIIAKNLNTKDNIITATGDVVVFSQSYYITSKKLIYDKTAATIELFEDVNLIKNNQHVSFSEYLFIDINKELKNIKPMLMLDNQSQLWFNSSDTNSTKSTYNLNNSTLSSCDCVDPAWSVSFSKGDYDTEEKWINTYNTTLYINKTPVIYTPYFGFSTDKTRRTGLLSPTIGISKDEGFIYAQPIYYAPQPNYDIEVVPQIRTDRGQGISFNYRYKDSAYSYLQLETGIFEENDDYQNENNLVNNKHFGSSLNYRRTNLFSDNKTSTDGLLVDLVSMNDVDYLDTIYDNDKSDYTDKFLESKIKYYYNTNQYYGDLEMKYYDDLSLDNNDAVMQTLPAVNLHKYSDNLLFDKLSYSLDTKVTRDTRKIGIGANTTEVYIPISYNFTLFDDYLNISLSEQVNYTNIDYTNDNDIYDSVNYAATNHIVSVYTDLVKPYDSFIHALNFSGTYTKPNVFKKEGTIYDPDLVGNAQNDLLSIFPVSGTKETISFGLSQSFYDKETIHPIVTHKVNQVYSYNDLTKKYEKGNLENDLRIYFQYGSIANRLFYNYDLKDIISSVSNLNLNYENSFLKLYHSYKKDETTFLKDEYITYSLGFNFYKYYNISYMEEYDMIQDISRKKQYIFGIDKKCWALNLKYVNSLVATNTTDGSVTRQDVVYVEFNLKQLFDLRQNYKLKQR
ncbi:MAG: LPS-assembly protein LptD [Arcobacteraceae bacterium]|nr:LPS-assembly protein LptD [Arcobacteraceae bacterium]